jgi:DNA-binding LytR/AlgR family response regulator
MAPQDIQKILALKEGRSTIYIKYKDILWFKAEGNYTTVYLLTEKQHVSRISLRELLLVLPARQFVQTHKSFIINKTHLTEIRTGYVLLDGQKLPVGRAYQKNAKALRPNQTASAETILY